MINRFDGEYRFLSNFWPCRELLNMVVGVQYSFDTAEHAYQAHKFLTPADVEQIRDAATPEAAKSLGRKLPCRPDWDLVKGIVMRRVLEVKFAADTKEAQWLLATENEFLVEGNTWNDTYWGVCKGNGRNMLGHLLMDIRAGLRNAG